MRAFLTAAFVVLALTGCTSVIYPEARPSYLEFPERLPVKVALELPEGFEEYVWSGTASSWVCGACNADFHIGQPMANALRRTLAEAVDLVPDTKGATVVLTPEITGFKWSVDYDDGILVESLKIGFLGPFASSLPNVSSFVDLRLIVNASGHRQICIVSDGGRGPSRKAYPGVPGKRFDLPYVDSRLRTEGGMLAV